MAIARLLWTPQLFLICLVIAASSITGCAGLEQLREERTSTSPSNSQLGLSPTARAIESSLGIE